MGSGQGCSRVRTNDGTALNRQRNARPSPDDHSGKRNKPGAAGVTPSGLYHRACRTTRLVKASRASVATSVCKERGRRSRARTPRCTAPAAKCCGRGADGRVPDTIVNLKARVAAVAPSPLMPGSGSDNAPPVAPDRGVAGPRSMVASCATSGEARAAAAKLLADADLLAESEERERLTAALRHQSEQMTAAAAATANASVWRAIRVFSGGQPGRGLRHESRA